MTPFAEVQRRTGIRVWPLVIPAAFGIHVCEEFWGGFPAWSAKYLGFGLTDAGFLQIDSYVLAVIVVLGILASLADEALWLTVPLSTAMAVNGAAHVLMSAITRTYSPGAVSGALIFLPLGIMVLRRMYAVLHRSAFGFAMGMGVLMHAVVIVLARNG